MFARNLLKTIVTPLATGSTASRVSAAVATNMPRHRLHSQPDAEVQTPSQALQLLREGHDRFLKGTFLSPARNLQRLKEKSSKPGPASQKPFAAFLSCADSRVPVEIIFDQGFGDVFVTRVAGNVVTTEIIASLEVNRRSCCFSFSHACPATFSFEVLAHSDLFSLLSGCVRCVRFTICSRRFLFSHYSLALPFSAARSSTSSATARAVPLSPLKPARPFRV